MTYICAKWLKYLRNGYNMWEMTQICGKQLKYLGNGFNMWELTWRFLEMAKIFVKWLRYMGHFLSI